MPQQTITNSDIELLPDIVELADVERHPPGPEALFAMFDQLRRLVDFDWASLQVMNSSTVQLEYAAGEQTEDCGWEVSTAEDVESINSQEGTEVFRELYWQDGCSLPDRLGRPVTTSTLSCMTERQWATDPLHTEFMTDIADEFLIGYPIGGGRSVRALGVRGFGSFSDREMVLLDLLRPHLAPLLLATAQAGLVNGGSRIGGRASLTPRQIAVMRMVQAGHSNTQIGRRMGISEGTVRKHLENVNTRLGVQSRTAAVGVAFGLGDLQPAVDT